jgi:hypothetical protein
MTTETYGARKRPSGAFIPWYLDKTGKKIFIDHQIKKSERGALTCAKRAYESQ